MLERTILLLTIFLPLAFSQDQQICIGVPEFGFVASTENCAIYYQCIEGIPYRLQCPRGNYFSTARQTCVLYDESDCVLLTTTEPPPELPTCADVPEFGFIPSIDACDYYYQCIEGIQYLLKCPRGLYFSFAQQTCVAPDDSDCPLISPPTPTPGPEIPPTCDDVPEFGFIPSLEMCDYYYQCIEGIQYLLKCPRGLYFSFERQTCVLNAESDCYRWISRDEDEDEDEDLKE